VRRIGHVGDQAHLNRGPDYGIIDRVEYMNTDYEVEWQIPADSNKGKKDKKQSFRHDNNLE
jgi:hypothetical protein